MLIRLSLGRSSCITVPDTVAVAVLRELRVTKAAPLMREIAGDPSVPPSSRSEAMRALGVIDLANSERAFLDGLDASGH